MSRDVPLESLVYRDGRLVDRPASFLMMLRRDVTSTAVPAPSELELELKQIVSQSLFNSSSRANKIVNRQMHERR